MRTVVTLIVCSLASLAATAALFSQSSCIIGCDEVSCWEATGQCIYSDTEICNDTYYAEIADPTQECTATPWPQNPVLSATCWAICAAVPPQQGTDCEEGDFIANLPYDICWGKGSDPPVFSSVNPKQVWVIAAK